MNINVLRELNYVSGIFVVGVADRIHGMNRVHCRGGDGDCSNSTNHRKSGMSA